MQTSIRRGLLVLGAVACAPEAELIQPAGPSLAVGTWGGDNAAVIVTDTLAHVHVGCTFGNFAAPVVLDAAGRFEVTGSYVLRAYPITVGPSVPARFSGTVTGAGAGATMTLTVAVNDTVQHAQTTLGPVTVTLGKDAKMGPCPICIRPRPTP